MKGKQLLKYYEDNKNLNPKYRKQLANTITEYLISNNSTPGPKTFKKLADKIVDYFTTEVKVRIIIEINFEIVSGFF